MIEIKKSRDGNFFAAVKKINIHSPYNPEREAERFLSEVIGGSKYSSFLILGPGLCYLQKALLKMYSGTKIISVFYSTFFYTENKVRRQYSFDFESEESLSGFLSSHIDEFDIEGLKVIEWPPSARAFPSISMRVNEVVIQFLREMNGNILSLSYFGKKWLHNFFLNYLFIEKVNNWQNEEKPICIAASGSSLGTAIPLLAEIRNFVSIWALPSSVKTLLSRGIKPDLIVSTDTGFFASTHLFFSGAKIPVAMPLSAARGVWKIGAHIYCILQNTFYENAVLNDSDLPCLSIPQNGTVAGTAMNIALKISSKPVIFFGLDFCYRDILSHARPHTFDNIFEKNESRTKPVYSQIFERAVEFGGSLIDGKRVPRSMQTYAGWFSKFLTNKNRRVFRFNPSVVKIDNIINISKNDIMSMINRNIKIDKKETEYKRENISERANLLLKVINKWIGDLKKYASLNGSTKNIFLDKYVSRILSQINMIGMVELKKLLTDDTLFRNKLNAIISQAVDYLGTLKKELEEYV